MERNLRVLSIWWVARWFWLGEAIWVIYLIDDRGLTLGQVAMFEAVFSAIALAAEVPTGVLADRRGRKAALLLGSLLFPVGVLVFGLATTLPVLLLAHAVLAFGESSYSGADSAMLFETLRDRGRDGEFVRRLGSLNALSIGALMSFAAIGSALVPLTSLRAPLLLSAATLAPAALLALVLREPPHESGEPSAFWRTAPAAAGQVLRSPSMRAATLLLAIGLSGILIMTLTLQPLILEFGVPRGALGAFIAVQLGVSAAASWLAEPIRRLAGLSGTLAVAGGAASLAILAGIPGTIWLFPVFILPAAAFPVIEPVVHDFLSRRAARSVRATVISVAAMSSAAMGGLTSLAFGFVADRAGLDAAFAFAAMLLALLTVLALGVWSKSGDTSIEPPDAMHLDGSGLGSG